jgi:hypothetical protein
VVGERESARIEIGKEIHRDVVTVGSVISGMKCRGKLVSVDPNVAIVEVTVVAVGVIMEVIEVVVAVMVMREAVRVEEREMMEGVGREEVRVTQWVIELRRDLDVDCWFAWIASISCIDQFWGVED